MANPKIVNSIDYDLAAIRAGGAVPSVPGKVKLVHHFGFDAAASFQRIGVPTRKIFSVQDGGICRDRDELRHPASWHL